MKRLLISLLLTIGIITGVTAAVNPADLPSHTSLPDAERSLDPSTPEWLVNPDDYRDLARVIVVDAYVFEAEDGYLIVLVGEKVGIPPFFRAIQFPTGLISMDAFKKTVDNLVGQNTGKKKTITDWLNKIRFPAFQSVGDGLASNTGSEKYMVTRNKGMLDLEHFLNYARDGYIAAQKASKMKNGENKLKAYETKVLLKADDGERNDVTNTSLKGWGKAIWGTGGSFPDPEDMPSNFLGFKFGRKLFTKYQGKEIKLDDVVKDLHNELKTYSPLKTDKEEQKFINAFNKSMRARARSTGLGDIIHNRWDLKEKYKTPSVVKSDYFSTSKRDLTFREGKRGTLEWSQLKFRYIDLTPIINEVTK
ncbi:hypothetical protein BVX99_01735 [bacterium F16]|nr:hypothetical protein BVX99_01735 [bacterium F16]